MTAAPKLQTSLALARPDPARVITVAVAGNPNSGKSTLINALAGTRLQVGNWPGVTVEKKEASLEHAGRPIRLVDLPGTYSLSPFSQEEIVTRDYLAHERPDVVVNVVDATNLERNLYLTVQLLELGIPVVMALNIHDEADAKGFRIDARAIEERLGIRVVPTSATKRRGLAELLEATVAAADGGEAVRPARLSYGRDLDRAALAVADLLEQSAPPQADRYPRRWLVAEAHRGGPARPRGGAASTRRGSLAPLAHLREAHGGTSRRCSRRRATGSRRGSPARSSRRPPHREGRAHRADRPDRAEPLPRHPDLPRRDVARLQAHLRPVGAVRRLDRRDGERPVQALGRGAPRARLGARTGRSRSSTTASSRASGSSSSSCPVIFAMMFFITFLEGSGYMARAAFVMDKAMHAMGLHGKSFIPMVLGFGCNVPGIYATRTLESWRDRVLTALLIPLMSCGARLPVYVLFVGVFFPGRPGTVIWSLYVVGIVLAIAMGVVFKRTLFRGEAPAFIMELPPYRMPSLPEPVPAHLGEGEALPLQGGHLHPRGLGARLVPAEPAVGRRDKKDSYLGRAGQVMAPGARAARVRHLGGGLVAPHRRHREGDRRRDDGRDLRPRRAGGGRGRGAPRRRSART